MKRLGLFAMLLLLLGLVVGCSAVRPYQKEHLADPIMQNSQEDAMRELKWLEAREGSTGGVGGSGGGCACR